MTVAPTISTAEELLRHASRLGRCELVQGELIMMSPSGFRHGVIAARLAQVLANEVSDRQLGVVLGAETGFLLARDPDTVRAPDAAFLRAARLKNPPKRGFFPGPPDLAVEVLSPDDTASQVLAKVKDWLDAGTIEVWIVDPERRTIAVHRADRPVQVLAEADTISANDLLPGWKMNVAGVFE